MVAHERTDERGCDLLIVFKLIDQVGHIDLITVDEGYDQIKVYESAQVHLNQGCKIMIHSRANAVVSASEQVALRW